MPYQMNDPHAIRAIEPDGPTPPGLSPEEAEVARDADATTHDALAALIRELGPPIKVAADEKAADAVAQVRSTSQFSTLAGAGLSVRAAWRAFEDARAAAGRDGTLSAAGRDVAIEQAAEKRDATIAKIAENVMSDAGDALLRLFPGTPVPTLSADLAAHASFVVQSADVVLPETLLQQAADLLRIATDPDAGRDDRTRATRLLDAAYHPLLVRFAGSPPRHWTRWAGLARDLAALIGSHVDTTFGRPYHRVAVGAAARFRQDFGFITGMVRELGKWDDTILTGAESFRAAA
jgi:hypothetical protein